MKRLPPMFRAVTPAELAERLEAERRGMPFVLYLDEGRKQRIVDLDSTAERSIGREPSPPEPTEQREAGEPQPAEGAGAAAPEAPTEPEPQDPEAAHESPQDEGPAPERKEGP